MENLLIVPVYVVLITIYLVIGMGITAIGIRKILARKHYMSWAICSLMFWPIMMFVLAWMNDDDRFD